MKAMEIEMGDSRVEISSDMDTSSRPASYRSAKT